MRVAVTSYNTFLEHPLSFFTDPPSPPLISFRRMSETHPEGLKRKDVSEKIITRYVRWNILRTPLNWSDPQAIKNYEKYGQFARSKLMMHMLAMALHRRMVRSLTSLSNGKHFSLQMLDNKSISVNVIELAREKRESNRRSVDL